MQGRDKKMKITITIIITAIIVVSVFLIGVGNVKIYEVTSSSMEPGIKAESLVLVSKQKKYEIGDVITYKTLQNTTPITHRIIEIFKTQGKYFITTKGDNNENEDPYPVSQEEIIGKVFLTIPYLGSLPKKLFSYKTVFLTIYIPSGFIVGKLVKKMTDTY